MGALYSKNSRGGRRVSLFGQTVETALAREMDDQKIRYQPESLDILMEKTHFSKFELKYLYQCFKQNCPSGYVTREQFIAIFRSFFSIHRLSDASQYAELVFNTFDDDRNNRISFSEFAILLSLFSKGTLEQRLEWLFDLYDCNGRGYIVEEDHVTVCRAMYALVGVHYFKDKHIPAMLRRHIKHQFLKLDRDKSGKITRAEFIQGCLSDPNIITSMEVLRSVW
uniref:Hippocalcin-like protein 4 n=1 Tax=Haemonchus contortus TaxID=6289 RepID=A0A7I4Z4T6_HAECO